MAHLPVSFGTEVECYREDDGEEAVFKCCRQHAQAPYHFSMSAYFWTQARHRSNKCRRFDHVSIAFFLLRSPGRTNDKVYSTICVFVLIEPWTKLLLSQLSHLPS